MNTFCREQISKDGSRFPFAYFVEQRGDQYAVVCQEGKRFVDQEIFDTASEAIRYTKKRARKSRKTVEELTEALSHLPKPSPEQLKKLEELIDA